MPGTDDPYEVLKRIYEYCLSDVTLAYFDYDAGAVNGWNEATDEVFNMIYEAYGAFLPGEVSP